MARALNYYDYATYGQVLMIIEMAIVLVSIANNQYIYVLLSNPQDYDKKDVVFSSFIINLIVSAVAFILLFLTMPVFVSKFHNKGLDTNLLLYAMCVFPMLIMSSFNYVLYFFKRVKHALLIEVLFNLLKVGAIVTAVQVFHSVQYIFIFLLVIHFFILVFYFRSFPVYFWAGRFRRNIMSKFFQYGYSLGIIAIIGILIKRTDGFMVSAMRSPRDYAIYRMGAIEVPFLMTIFSAITTVVLPDVTKLLKQNKMSEIVTLKRKAVTGAVLVMYPTLVSCFLHGPS